MLVRRSDEARSDSRTASRRARAGVGFALASAAVYAVAWQAVKSPSPAKAGADEAAGVVLRVFAATPPNEKAKFQPGPPIPEEDLSEAKNPEARFAELLKERNPGWKFAPLGKLSATAASLASAETETPEFNASVRLYEKTESKGGMRQKVGYEFSIPAGSSLHQEIRGVGASRDSDAALPTRDAAYQVGESSERGVLQRVISFETLTSGNKG
jgi:hypothetical protein